MKKVTLFFVGLLMLAVFAACNRAGDGGTTPPPPQPPAPPVVTDTGEVAPPEEVVPIDYTISILTVSHSGELIAGDHPAIRQLETLTGYNIELEMLLNANFAEQMNLRLAAQDLPGIVVITGNTLPIVQAVLGGAFWDLTDHLPQWPNLATANPAVLNNVSINGRHFGVYRQRPVGRPGMVYRSDWLDYLIFLCRQHWMSYLIRLLRLQTVTRNQMVVTLLVWLGQDRIWDHSTTLQSCMVHQTAGRL